MRKTRLVILPGARCLHQLGCLLLFLACPTIAFKGQENRDIQPDCRFLILKQNWIPNKSSEGIGCDADLGRLKSGLWTLDNGTGILSGNNSTKEKCEASSFNNENTEKKQTPEAASGKTMRSSESRLFQRSGGLQNRKLTSFIDTRRNSLADSARRINLDSRREISRKTSSTTRLVAGARDERRIESDQIRNERRTREVDTTRSFRRNYRVERARVMHRLDSGRTLTNRVSLDNIERRSVHSERRRYNANPTVRDQAKDTRERRINVEERLARNNLNRRSPARPSTRVLNLKRETAPVNLSYNRLKRETSRNDQTPAERNNFRTTSTRTERNNRVQERSEVVRLNRRTDTFLNNKRRMPSITREIRDPQIRAATIRSPTERRNSPSRNYNTRHMDTVSQTRSRTDSTRMFQERLSSNRPNRLDSFTSSFTERRESRVGTSSMRNNRRFERVSPQLMRVSPEIRNNIREEDSAVRVNANGRKYGLQVSAQRFNSASLSERRASSERRQMEPSVRYERSSIRSSSDRELSRKISRMKREVLLQTNARRSLTERNTIQRRILDSTKTLDRRTSANRAQIREGDLTRSMERHFREATERSSYQLYGNRNSESRQTQEKLSFIRRVLSREMVATRTNSVERRFGSGQASATPLARIEMRNSMDSRSFRLNPQPSYRRNNRMDSSAYRRESNYGREISSLRSSSPSRRISENTRIQISESEQIFSQYRSISHVRSRNDKRGLQQIRLNPEYSTDTDRNSDYNQEHRSLKRNTSVRKNIRSGRELGSNRESYSIQVRSIRVRSVEPVKDNRFGRKDANDIIRSSKDQQRRVSDRFARRQQLRKENPENRRYYFEIAGEKVPVKGNNPSNTRFLQNLFTFVKAKLMTTNEEMFPKSENNLETLWNVEGHSDSYNLPGTIAGGILCATLFLNVQKKVY